MKNKLMELYDKSYNETFTQILSRGALREEAKNLLGLMYKETWNMLIDTKKNLKQIEAIFEQVKLRHGLSTVS